MLAEKNASKPVLRQHSLSAGCGQNFALSSPHNSSSSSFLKYMHNNVSLCCCSSAIIGCIFCLVPFDKEGYFPRNVKGFKFTVLLC